MPLYLYPQVVCSICNHHPLLLVFHQICLVKIWANTDEKIHRKGGKVYVVNFFFSLVQVLFSWPMKSRESLALDIIDPFVTGAGLVHDTIDTNYLGTKRQHSWLCFHNFWTQQTGSETEWKAAVCLFFVPFLLTGPVRHLHFMSSLKKNIQTLGQCFPVLLM